MEKKKDHGIITVYFSVVELSEHLLNTQVGPTGCVILDISLNFSWLQFSGV